MTGIGLMRFLSEHHLPALFFVDSDPCLESKKIMGVAVNSPGALQDARSQHDNLIVVVAVALKEDEIVENLKKMSFSANDFVCYSDYCGCFFTIDIVGQCNLKCPSCAHSMDNIKNPQGFMSKEYFRKVLHKIVDEVSLVSHICLYSWGEPFLHPELHLFIDEVHAMGIATAVSSNFSITGAQQIEKVVKAAPDYLKISLSGYYPEAYDSTHTGGNIHLVKSNLYRLRYLIDRAGSAIHVEVNYHLYKNNIGDDLRMMRQLCDELGFSLATVYANVTPIERLIDYCEGRTDENTAKLTDLLLVGIDEGLEITASHRHLPCRFLTNQVNINWDGSVPLCCVCFDHTKTTISQDFLQNSLAEINEKKEKHPLCVKCLRYGFPGYLLGVNQKGWEKVANKAEK